MLHGTNSKVRGWFVGMVSILLAVPVLTLGSSGCSGKEVSDTAADIALPPRKEEKLGQKFSRKVENKSKLHPDQSVQQYIRDLGETAVASARADVPDAIEFEFHVIDKPNTINAFAGPGGQIYFYSGLILEAENTAEVMAVMSHEVAHVTQRHIAKRLIAIYGADALASAALGEKPSLVGELATKIVTKGFLLKYSRKHEREADKFGFEYMVQTKYDPRGFVTFFESLKSKGASPPTILSSHPNPSDRIEKTKSRIEKRSNLPSAKGEKAHSTVVQKIRSSTADRMEQRDAGGVDAGGDL